jgi:hypothetical protein
MKQDSYVKEPVRQAEHVAREVTANPWFERLARFGYAAKGVVYLIAGLLSAQAALGMGGQTTDTQGALHAIAAQSQGKVMLAALTIGLVGYVLWQLARAIVDPDNKGDDAKGLAQRAFYVVSGLVYAGLAVSAIQLVIGAGTGGGDETQGWTARLLGLPFGRWLVIAAGAGVVGVGLYYLYRAFSSDLRKELRTEEMSEFEETWAIGLGRFGTAARGIVFGIIGLFLIQAALQFDPNKAQGPDGALQALAQQPFGPWLLGAVAFGLAAYGVYMFAQARYRRIFLR